MRLQIILTVALSINLMAGCDSKPAMQSLPEVNNENCKTENIAKIQDKGMQQEFSGKCLRRGTFKPSTPRAW